MRILREQTWNHLVSMRKVNVLERAWTWSSHIRWCQSQILLSIENESNSVFVRLRHVSFDIWFEICIWQSGTLEIERRWKSGRDYLTKSPLWWKHTYFFATCEVWDEHFLFPDPSCFWAQVIAKYVSTTRWLARVILQTRSLSQMAVLHKFCDVSVHHLIEVASVKGADNYTKRSYLDSWNSFGSVNRISPKLEMDAEQYISRTDSSTFPIHSFMINNFAECHERMKILHVLFPGGSWASRHFTCLPTTSPKTTFTTEEFLSLLLVRLHLGPPRGWPILQMRSTVGRARSPQIRLLTGRPVETSRDSAEICVVRICREASARVKENQLLRDLNIVVPVTDHRRIEVIANGLPFWGGKQLAIDTTVVSVLTGLGLARSRWEGQAIHEAENDKRRRFHELVDGDRCHLLAMAFEVAGRWSREAGLVQVPVGAEGSPPINPAAVLPTLDSHADEHHAVCLGDLNGAQWAARPSDREEQLSSRLCDWLLFPFILLPSKKKSCSITCQHQLYIR